MRWEVHEGKDIKNLSVTFNFNSQFGQFVQYKDLFNYLNDLYRKKKYICDNNPEFLNAEYELGPYE